MPKLATVRMVPDGAQFVSDSQDVQPIREYLYAAMKDNDTRERVGNCDAFFVLVSEKCGEYTDVWGMVGIVPYLSKLVTKFI